MIVSVITLDFAGKLGFEFRSVEMCDGSGAALAGYGVEPSCLNIVAYGGDGSEAGHHYSFNSIGNNLQWFVKEICAESRCVFFVCGG